MKKLLLFGLFLMFFPLSVHASLLTVPWRYNTVTNVEYPYPSEIQRVGIGTTSPYTALSVVGQIVGSNFTATTSATSTFPALLSTNSTTTALNISGTLTGSGLIDCPGNTMFVKYSATTNNFGCGNVLFPSIGAAGSNTNIQYNSSGSFAGNNNFVFVNPNVGIGTTSPSNLLSVHGSSYISSNLFVGGTITSTSTINCSVLSTDSGGKFVCQTNVGTTTASLRNQTATISSVNTFTPTASSTYSVMISTDVKVISAGTLTITAIYTNTNGVASTATFFPMGLTSAGLTGTGSPSLTPLIITPLKNTAVTVVATFTGVSITYDIDASILPIGSATN